VIRVAYQGEAGAYGEAAIRRHFGDAARPLPCPTFADVTATVRTGAAEWGVLPVENSIAGPIQPSLDALAASGLTVAGEVVVEIHHCLMALPGTTIEAITEVRSHPVALAQCTRFLTAHPHLRATPAWDTAGAARDLASSGDPTIAAIASRDAARIYGLEILATDIEDQSDNRTRFVIVKTPRR